MDRLVNIRMRADLSETIQQFTQLNNVLTGLSSTMSGMGAGFGLGGAGSGMGGMGMPGMGIPGVGVPSGGGGGGTIPGMGATNPAGRNRGRGGGNLPPSAGSTGPLSNAGITSQMFGLAQIGFALEDYQYAGWRGVMNNVPWIAQAVGSMIGGPGLGQAALLGTAIGVPLANAAYESMSPIEKDAISRAILGGPGMSNSDLRIAQIDQMQYQLDSTPGGSYKRFGLETGIARSRRDEARRAGGMDILTNDYSQSTYMAGRNRSIWDEFSQGYGERGGFERLQDSIGGSLGSFSSSDRSRARRLIKSEYESMSLPMQVLSDAGSFVRSAGLAMVGVDSDVDQRRLDAALERVKKEKVDWSDELISELDKMKSGQDPNWERIMILADKMGRDVYFQMRDLRREFRRSKTNMEITRELDRELSQMTSGELERASEGGSGFTGPLSRKAEMDRQNRIDSNALGLDNRFNQYFRSVLDGSSGVNSEDEIKKIVSDKLVNEGYSKDVADAEAARIAGGRNAAIGQRDARIAGKFDSLIRSTARASSTNFDVAGQVAATLSGQGVGKDEAARIGREAANADQIERESKKTPDQKMFDQYHDLWVATVKSDMFQAARASRNKAQYNEYLRRIKIKIRDDLVLAGISQSSVDRFTDLIYNEAFRDANEAFDDAKTVAKAKYDAMGVPVNDRTVNMEALQSLQGEMSNDLNAVYGNAQTNSFYVGRMMQQQYRRQQIRLNRFGGR